MTDQQETLIPGRDRQMMRRLLLKITLYYGGLTLMLLLLANLTPQFFDTLPFGGLAELAGSAPTEYQYEEALLNGDEDDVEALIPAVGATLNRFQDAKVLLYAMLGALLTMIPIAWVHRSIHLRGEYDHSLDETAMVLPSVVAGIVLIVQHSLALAFSLAGIVAGVQFRRALNDTFDTLFIFVAIGVGIAAGIKALDVGFVLAVFFCYVTLIICLNSDGLESHHLFERKREKAMLKEQHAREAEARARTHPDEDAR